MGPTIVIDFDGTIAQWISPFFKQEKPGQALPIGDPLPNVKENIQRLYDMGFEIVISSARTSYKLNKSEEDVEAEVEAMKDFLDINGIPYHCIDNGTYGKIPAYYYIDDRGVRFEGNWKITVDFIEKHWKESGGKYA